MIAKLEAKAMRGSGTKQKPPLFGSSSINSSQKFKQAPDIFGNIIMSDNMGNQAAQRQLYKNGGKVLSKAMSTAKPN